MSETVTQTTRNRLSLLDAARGVALLAMTSYHFTWDLEFFGYIEPGTATHGLWKLYARAIASTFLFLAGFSLVLAHRNGIRWKPFAIRIGMVAAAALGITIATVFAFPDAVIYFGILHAIAAASLIGLLFLRLPVVVTLLVAAAALAAPHYLRSTAFDGLWLLWLGLAENPQRSNDYVPLLPWIAPALVGIAAAKLALRHGLVSRLSEISARPAILLFAGRHSLAFYLLHQPLLIALLFLASLVIPATPTARWLGECTASCIANSDDPSLCEKFCACAGTELGKAGLFRQIAPGWPNHEPQSTMQDVQLRCSVAAE